MWLSEESCFVSVNGFVKEVEKVLISLMFFVDLVNVDKIVIGLKWLRKCGIDFLEIKRLFVINIKLNNFCLVILVCVL